MKVSDTEVENLYFFNDRLLRSEYDINIENHYIKHGNSIITMTSKFNGIGIDTIHNNKILEEMAIIYAEFKKSI